MFLLNTLFFACKTKYVKHEIRKKFSISTSVQCSHAHLILSRFVFIKGLDYFNAYGLYLN